MKTHMTHKQAGMALLSAALYFVLALLVSASAVGLYFYISDNNAAAAARENLTLMGANIASRFEGESGYGALDTNGQQLVIDLRVAPRSLVQGSTVVNEFGGQYTFGSNNGGITGGAADAYMEITTNEIPQDVCLTLSTSGIEQWRQIEINGTLVDGTMTEARAECVDGANTLVFTRN